MRGKEDGERASTYCVRFTIEQLTPSDIDDPEEYAIQIMGEVLCRGGEKAGALEAWWLQLGRAYNSDVPARDVFEAANEDVAEYYRILWDPRNNELRRSLTSSLLLDVLIINHVLIDPKHRGHDLGVLAANSVFDTFGSHCGVFAARPFPLQYSSVRKRFGEFPEFTLAQRAAKEKLHRYWLQVGLKRIRGGYHAVDAEHYRSRRLGQAPIDDDS